MTRPLAILCAAAALGACAGPSPVGNLRYQNRAPVWQVNDREDVPRKPEERPFASMLYHLDGFFVRSVIRTLDVRDPHRAANVNSMDEVPDSTWFTNRIGVRDMSVDEIRRGPNDPDGPENHKPWTIKSTKVGGVSVGFIIKDSRGRKYLLKFDERGFPEIETAADVIVQRILWAIGYNTPEDRIVYFDREDLVLAQDAVVKAPFGDERPMTREDLEDRLAKINIVPGEPIRGLISRFIPGVPIGGYPREGVREDDPNDLVPHEDRRDLRGLYPIASWVGHTDIKEGNTLDSWIEDPEDPDVHYVVHYLLDFGKSLGTLAHLEERHYSGFAYSTDIPMMVKSLPLFGLWKRPWEGIDAPELLGIGLWESERFDPGAWKSHTPYFPFWDADRFDGFWGAKLVMRFSRAHIEAIVGEARYSDPRAADYMVETLIERQRKIGRHWFGQVNPLDEFELAPDVEHDGRWSLCFDDLMLVYGLTGKRAPERTTYELTTYARDGDATGWSRTVPATGARTCPGDIRPVRGKDRYTMVRIVTVRGDGKRSPGLVVHLAAAPGGGMRIIGLRRQ